jgi:hypothetical protein
MPRLSLPPKERDRRSDLWNKIHAYIRNRSGWIVTQPSQFPLKFECKPDTDLPKLLANLGYLISDAGSAERFMPEAVEMRQNGTNNTVTIDRLAPTTVSIWTLDLPR